MSKEEGFVYGGLAADEVPAWCADLPRLTQLLMDAHYAEQRELVALHMAPELTWIGSMEWQFTQGLSNMLAELARENGIAREIEASEFQVVYADEHCCTVAGWMRAKTPESSGMLVAAMQRATFQYACIEGVPKAVHIHVSNSWDVVEKDEIFPFRAGRETYRYVQDVLRRQYRVSPKLMIRDVRRRVHILTADEIMLVEAQAGHSVLHCVDRRIEVCTRMAQHAAALPECFIRVHRSYLVNVHYVIGIKRFALHLCNGLVVPVPEKRYTRVRRMIETQVL